MVPARSNTMLEIRLVARRIDPSVVMPRRPARSACRRTTVTACAPCAPERVVSIAYANRRPSRLAGSPLPNASDSTPARGSIASDHTSFPDCADPTSR
jgi:hypothetical protein